MEIFIVLASMAIVIIAILSIAYQPNTKGWITLKCLCQDRFSKYEGSNKEEIETKIEEIYYWCDILIARKSYLMSKSNSIVANRITYLHVELIELGFFDDKLEELKDAYLQRTSD